MKPIKKREVSLEKKKAEQLKQLQSIFRVLTAKEWGSLIQNYRKSYERKSELERTLELFHALRDSADEDSNVLVINMILPVKEIPGAYEVCECLVPQSEFEIGTGKSTRAKLHLRRLIFVAERFIGRGLIKISGDILSLIFEEAKRNELYDIQIEAKLGELLISERLTSKEKTKEITEDINELQRMNQLLIKSKTIFRARSQQSEFASTSDFENWKKELILLDANYQKSKSSYVKSLYLLTLVEYYYLRNNYWEQQNTLEQLIELLAKYQFLTNSNRMCVLHVRLAYIKLIVVDFNAALNEIEKGLAYLKGVPQVAHTQLEKVKVLILLNRLDAAAEHATWLALNYGDSEIDLISNTTSYYFSVISLLKQDYATCREQLTSIKTLTKDKEGWNSWIRYMKILCWMELKKYDEADKAIERFRKYTQRHQNVTPRIKLVVKVFVDLAQKGFDFNVTATRKAKEIQLLKSVQEDVRWLPSSPELILFHDWFEAKLLKKEYAPNFEVYREAMNQVEKVD